MTHTGQPTELLSATPRPALTSALIMTIGVIFAFEVLVPVAPGDNWYSPSTATLMAYGGMSGHLVLEKGEVHRLLTAPLLHAGPLHLAFNALALKIAGDVLERMLGRWWLGALLILGALAGSLASVLVNAPNVIGVGASGAIMALFGCFLAMAFRFPPGPVRRSFLGNGLGTLLPSLLPGLLPMVTGGEGFAIDYAAHGGGAALGLVFGGLLLWLWPADHPHPGGRGFAKAVTVLGLAGIVFAVVQLFGSLSLYRYVGAMIPEQAIPKTDAEARAAGPHLSERYPLDPRSHFYRALDRIAAKDLAGAETALQEAVRLADAWPQVFPADFRVRLHMVQALVLADRGKLETARAVARPACTAQVDDSIRGPLRRAGLCR
ncbi:MAG TPA: rhomboid family intramembrane serine protease [Beijerinckiaceae bacterium]|nr:rhomboid family intramembrane serine protease [Beijerinckiaceae bacterium]